MLLELQNKTIERISFTQNCGSLIIFLLVQIVFTNKQGINFEITNKGTDFITDF